MRTIDLSVDYQLLDYPISDVPARAAMIMRCASDVP